VFSSEKALVDAFSSSLARHESSFKHLCLVREFQYPEGRSDLVGTSPGNEVVAFEAKLHKWRDALHQAYRNSFYAHYSYVILPANRTKVALQNRSEFERRGVGLCSVSHDGLGVEIDAPRKEPIRTWLTRDAVMATRQGLALDSSEAEECR